MEEAILFSHRMTQLSKALWKAIEKDWRAWVKPHGLNINEHHILWILYEKNGTTISDLSNHGAMHVSTAFNFSKKLEERELISFSKNDDDKRNTYLSLTEDGDTLFKETLRTFNPYEHAILNAMEPFQNIYGSMPEFKEVSAIIRELYDIDYDLDTSIEERMLSDMTKDPEREYAVATSQGKKSR